VRGIDVVRDVHSFPFIRMDAGASSGTRERCNRITQLFENQSKSGALRSPQWKEKICHGQGRNIFRIEFNVSLFRDAKHALLLSP
jgi:hypothetical protein